MAVALVVAYHLELPYSERGGTIGVTMFFALSGFLITSILLDEAEARGSIHLPSFSMRRVLRLVPALTVVCLVVGTWAAATDLGDRTTAGLPWVLLYVGNWGRVIEGWGSLGAFEHAWSLGVEEQFYLVWPVTLIVLGALVRWRDLASRVLVVSLGGAAASLAWRLHLWDGADPVQSAARLYNGTDAVADQLLLGGALAAGLHLLRRRGVPLALRRVAVPAGTAALAFLLWVAAFRPGGDSMANTRLYLTWGATAFAVASTLLVASAVLVPRAPLSRLLATRPIVAVGQRSYGAYLWHYPLIVLLAHEAPGLGTNTRRVLAVAATAAVTALSYRYVEQPALRRKARFERVRAEPAPAGGAGRGSDVVEVAPGRGPGHVTGVGQELRVGHDAEEHRLRVEPLRDRP